MRVVYESRHGPLSGPRYARGAAVAEEDAARRQLKAEVLARYRLIGQTQPGEMAVADRERRLVEPAGQPALDHASPRASLLSRSRRFERVLRKIMESGARGR